MSKIEVRCYSSKCTDLPKPDSPNLSKMEELAIKMLGVYRLATLIDKEPFNLDKLDILFCVCCNEKEKTLTVAGIMLVLEPNFIESIYVVEQFRGHNLGKFMIDSYQTQKKVKLIPRKILEEARGYWQKQDS